MGKALVLGGGGITGVAWEIGIVMGLRHRGVDLTPADLIVGTSAGSVVGTLIATGADLGHVVAQHREAPVESNDLGAQFDPDQMVAALGALMQGVQSQQELRARIGAVALMMSDGIEADRVSVIASRLPIHDWPERRLLITGVDTADGEFVVWDRHADVSLVEAVAASCAVPGVWPPVTIAGRRYMDGGVRSTNNADLAAGHDPVVILAPFTVGLIGTLDDEIAVLGDATVVTVTPDHEALDAIGPNPLDASRRALALEAGLSQAAREADRVREAWMVEDRHDGSGEVKAGHRARPCTHRMAGVVRSAAGRRRSPAGACFCRPAREGHGRLGPPAPPGRSIDA